MVKRKEERKNQQEIELQDLENIIVQKNNEVDLSQYKV